jgi:hypothetical protein
MNEHDFDKLFDSQLPDLADKNWSKLAGKLESFNLQRKIAKLVWVLWGLGILGVLMMAITGGLFYQIQEHKQHLKNLESQLIAINQSKIFKQDTVYQKVILRDTIYRTSVYHNKTIDGFKLRPNIFVQNQGNEGLYYEKNYTGNNQEATLTERNKYDELQAINSKKMVLEKMRENWSAIVKPDSLVADFVNTSPQFSLIPSSLSVGLIGAYQLPNGDNFQLGDGSQFGFRTVLGYNNRKGQERWGVVLDFLQNNFSFTNQEAREGIINLPQNLPHLTDSHVRGADVRNISSYQFGMGLRYNLIFSTKFKPYFGLSWSTQFSNIYGVNYFTEDRIDKRERKFYARYDNLSSITNILGTNMGINYQLSNHFSTGLEVYYQSHISDPILTPNALGARLSLKCHF